jgi:hypothetical protein
MEDNELGTWSNRRYADLYHKPQGRYAAKATFGTIILSVLVSACATTKPQQEEAAVVASCPAPGTIVLLAKVMNPSFIRDYHGCDILVEATFLTLGNQGYLLGQYDTSANTTFQVLAPGGTPQTVLGGQSFGVFAGLPKAVSDVLFDLKQGDVVQLRGAPIGEFFRGNLVVGVFHATALTRK